MGSKFVEEIESQSQNKADNFVPNYLQYPPVNYHVDLSIKSQEINRPSIEESCQNDSSSVLNSVILKARIANHPDPDFIEIDLPPSDKQSMNDLIALVCYELNVDLSLFQVERLRKLPNTRLRRDLDVQRLKNYDELEVVLIEN